MKTGRYCLKDLLTHNEIEQIIIPEIQRDYVWQKNNVINLLTSISNRFRNKASTNLEINIQGKEFPDKFITDYLRKEYDKLTNNLKIGFIYAYHDSEYAGKLFLIDGQQRFTTLYLLLLAIYCENNKTAKFRELYFKNNMLKIDYKVRESSHEFMKEFVEQTLINTTGKNIKNSNKYYKYLYEEDITIKNLIQNYQEIIAFIDSNEHLKVDDNYNEFIEFIEEYIEVNYFDTNLSEQGEQLYLYMNSRGEFLSHHEIIKSEIVRKIGSGTKFIEKKKEVGNNWEVWQNYFWKNRGENESADIGFDEFLKWATVIHICTTENPQLESETINDRKQSKREAKENYIHRISDRISKQEEYLVVYQTKYLDADYLESVFFKTKELFSLELEYLPIRDTWLNKIDGVINYVILLPLLYFIKESTWEDNTKKQKDIVRLAMFLQNISYFESISKNPDGAVIDAIELVKLLCDEKQTDIICFLTNSKLKDKFKSILTENEIEKLELYRSSKGLRNEFEEVVWDITLDQTVAQFLKGNISLFFYTAKKYTVPPIENYTNINLDFIKLIKKYYKVFKDLMETCNINTNGKNSDLFRSALLTFGDYLVPSSGSYKFGDRIEGYTFGFYYNRDNREWESIIYKSKDILSSFLEAARKSNYDNILTFLNECISNYNETDWKELFIRHPSVLEYCNKKRVLFDNEHHIYLIEEKEKGYKEIQSFILKNQLESSENLGYQVDIFEHNICVLNIKFDENENKLVYNSPKNDCAIENDYAIDIIQERDSWSLKLIYRDEKTLEGKFDPFLKEGWVKVKGMNDRIEKEETLVYRYNKELSIIENVNKLTAKVILIYKEIENIFQENMIIPNKINEHSLEVLKDIN